MEPTQPIGPTAEEIDEMLAGYMETGLWASVDRDPEDYDNDDDPEYLPMNDLYSIDACENPEDARADCEAFAVYAIEDLRYIINAYGANWGSIGHNFLLTRDRHGTGFWDCGYGEAGKRLSEASRPYGGSGFQGNGPNTFRVGGW